MTEKCEICKVTIEKTMLDKLVGTTIKVKGTKIYVCQNCQKKHKDNLKKEVEKLVS